MEKDIGPTFLAVIATKCEYDVFIITYGPPAAAP